MYVQPTTTLVPSPPTRSEILPNVPSSPLNLPTVLDFLPFPIGSKRLQFHEKRKKAPLKVFFQVFSTALFSSSFFLWYTNFRDVDDTRNQVVTIEAAR